MIGRAPFPNSDRFDGIDVGRPVNAAVAEQVGLPVTLDVEFPQHAPVRDRFIEDTGAHGLALVTDVARQGNVDRQEFHRLACLPARGGARSACANMKL